MSERVLKINFEAGIAHPEYKYKVGFTTWVHSDLRSELIRWVSNNIRGKYFHHPRAHTWNFDSQADMEAFIAHRPMAEGVRLLPRYQFLDNVPFVYQGIVTVDVRQHEHLHHDRARHRDWFWDDIETWVYENCTIGRVGRLGFKRNSGERRGPLISHWEAHYVFEDARDATLFRVRWN